LASGNVLYNKNGLTNYPVRLASEIFSRCLELSNKKKELTLYDPCCGGGYLLTVLGFIHGNVITEILGSDINEDAIEIAQKNLLLLTEEGLDKRKNQIEKLYHEYGKQSHRDALNGIEYLQKKVKAIPIETKCFIADILKEKPNNELQFIADIIIVDVPYGKITSWSDEKDGTIDIMLNNLMPNISKETIIAVSMDKSQRICDKQFKRLDKITVGKRRIEIIKVKE
jgi:tRNA G10  N-methylase Trm11